MSAFLNQKKIKMYSDHKFPKILIIRSDNCPGPSYTVNAYMKIYV